ncbi:hypothetical protein EST38_g9414 [Candolleomyces aberdarensis]|uniref:F-box domain-containing protein n=1 Tax=Candolleomyces aberdarensis TaxID=2316362 RepID=A0A4Q2DC58_9AGAR|nr:hypothetical protein EST38_g9414 [Candolleomyces aberdarensis]
MLQRSKNAPLTVDFATYPPPFNDILCKITSQTNRLRDVVLRQDPNTALLDLPKILSSFESTAPILEKLVLQGADLYNGAGTNRYSTIPANFLQDGAPSLQHLDITRFAIHWDTLPLSITLTHLRLENVVPGNRPTRKLFSETLAKLLRLETIKISACLPHSGDASQPDSLPIILPSLRTLELQDFVAELRQFFSVTQIPQKAKVDLELSDEVLKSESLGSLFSALRASWTLPRDMVAGAARNSAQPDILDLRVVDSMTRCIPQIMCWFNNHDLPPNFDVENPPANLTVSTHTIAIGLNILLKAIAGRFGISSLRSFKIASNCIVLTRDTLELVKGLPKLDRIAIWNRHDVLSEFLGVLKKKKDHVLAFPSLRSIELHGIDFDEDLAGDSDAAIQALAAVLKSRKKIRSTIKRFAMTQCVNFLEHHWEVIQAALPKQAETYWDEDEHIIDPSEDEEEFEDSSDYGGWGY